MKTCKWKSQKHRNCQCPIAVEGMLRGKMIRRSLDLHSWEAAQNVVRDMEISGDPEEREVITIHKAGERFIASRGAKGNTEETVKKLERLVKQMEDFFAETPLDKITFDDAAKFYESWTLGPLTKTKQLERMRSFFNFCMPRKWITDNPCLGIEKPPIVEIPRKPFEKDELEKIEWAITIFPIKGIYGEQNRARLAAFITVLRWTPAFDSLAPLQGPGFTNLPLLRLRWIDVSLQ
jgi:hypothetical protein